MCVVWCGVCCVLLCASVYGVCCVCMCVCGVCVCLLCVLCVLCGLCGLCRSDIKGKPAEDVGLPVSIHGRPTSEASFPFIICRKL